MRVSFSLLAVGAADDVMIAGLLHDVLEKSSLSRAQIARRFGARVAQLVAACTNDPGLADAQTRYADSLRRCARVGPDALAVRAADLMDNCDRALALGEQRRFGKLDTKLGMLLAIGSQSGLNERLDQELRQRQRQIAKARRANEVLVLPRRASTTTKANRLAKAAKPTGSARRR